MAYDPEARETSNNAMIIGVVALVLVVLGALAYYATRQPDTTTVVTQPTTQVTKETVVEREVPVTGGTPNTIVVQPQAPAAAPATSPKVETKVTVNTSPGAAPKAPANPAPRGDTNVTVNTQPAQKAPATAPAGDGATGGTTSGGTSSNSATGKG